MLAKKELGQHWLFDEKTLTKIVEAAEVKSSDVILEVGPGLGTLTELLVKRAQKVIAVEADTELIPRLRDIKAQNLEIIEQDILKYDLRTLPAKYKVVANIPYYLTSKLIRALIESDNPPSLMALLVQKEVAERIVAHPGQMSVLSFSVQYYASATIKGIVAKELFDPMPKVDSAILLIKMRSSPYFEADPKKLFRLVKAGFGERRKQLHNSLAGGLHIASGEVISLLEQLNIKSTVRAQELSMEQWKTLYSRFSDSNYL